MTANPPADAQCDNCTHNWRFMRGVRQSGHCYMFRERVENCAQKSVTQHPATTLPLSSQDPLMKITTTIHLESQDAAWETRIDEAFTRVQEFTPELRVMPRKQGEKNIVRVAFNRIVVNGEFTLGDVERLVAYAVTVAGRAKSRAADYDPEQSLLGDSLRQAATNLVDTTAEFLACTLHATQLRITQPRTA